MHLRQLRYHNERGVEHGNGAREGAPTACDLKTLTLKIGTGNIKVRLQRDGVIPKLFRHRCCLA
jgi:hypothetical protein